MGKFINFLVPDYIYKADDDESKVIKLLIVSVSLYGTMLVFFKVINLMTGGEEVMKWQLWIPIILMALLCSGITYIAVLSFAHLIVRYSLLFLLKVVVPGVRCLYERFWEKSHMEEKESHSQTQEEIEESEETIDPDETDGIMTKDDCQPTPESKESPSFRSLLKCEEPDSLLNTINEMIKVDDDKMYFLTIILLLIQHDKLSFKALNVKEIHECLVKEFGEFLSYTFFSAQWKRLKQHDFNPKTIAEYKNERKTFYNDRDKDYDRYCKAGKKLIESGCI